METKEKKTNFKKTNYIQNQKTKNFGQKIVLLRRYVEETLKIMETKQKDSNSTKTKYSKLEIIKAWVEN